MIRVGVILILNIVFTVGTTQIAGPAASKLYTQFGLVGWAARAPFYLLPLLLTPLVLWIKTRPWQGLLAGLVLALPLGLWANATHCPVVVQIIHIAAAGFQGVVLSWLGLRLSHSSLLNSKK